MTLRRRLARLEARTAPPASSPPLAVLRPVVTPSAAGPVVVAAMVRRAGEPWRRLTREPGEALAAFIVRARDSGVLPGTFQRGFFPSASHR